MSELTVILSVPPAATGPNYHGPRRQSWKAKARAREQAGGAARAAMLAAELWGDPRWRAVAVLIRWYAPHAHDRPDRDNGIGRCKPYLDGLIDAGLIEDDNPDCVRDLRIEIDVDAGNPRIELLVERWEK